MKKLNKVISNNRGEGYIDVAVTVLIFMMLIVLSLNVFSFLTLKQDMDYYAKEMIYAASSFGKTNDEVLERQEILTEETGIDPVIVWETEYFNESQQTVQYGENISITLQYDTYLQGFGTVQIPITLTVKHSGLSMTYWK
ncbi:MAG: DUF4320 family protein [Clostridia bacterium]